MKLHSVVSLVILATVLQLGGSHGDGSTSNIALQKTSFQSSDYSTGHQKGEAYRAVDGNNSQNRYKDWSCSVTNKDPKPWWAVDLGKRFKVTSVTIFNRAEAFSYRLKNFDIIVTDKRPSNASPPQASQGLCIYQSAQPQNIQTFTCANGGVSGRYVVIQLRYSEYLTLCEVQVFGDPAPRTNIALKKTAFESSVYSKGEAYRAVDGNTSPNRFKDYSCSVTKKDAKPWWAVDLGARFKVTDVTIYNRLENYSYRLKNFDIIVTDQTPSTSSPPSSSKGLCFYQSAQPQNIQTFTCANGGVSGRYVVIQLRYSEYLTLCEVQVFGDPAPSTTILSLKKPAFQSSDYSTGAKKGEAYRAVDGNTSPLRFKYWSCSVTNKDPKPWWAVDLETSSLVTRVTIYNRKENFSYRLKNFNIIVTDQRPSASSPPEASQGLCFYQSAQPQDVQTFTCAHGGVLGRYVIIALGYSEHLTLCEVQVYGSEVKRPNLALKKSTFQSSDYSTGAKKGEAYRAVDGNTSPLRFKYWSCSVTNKEAKPWWAVDLGARYKVTDVTIYNRAENYSYRLKNFDIIVTDQRPSTSSPPSSSQGLCFYQSAQPQNIQSFTCVNGGVSGRYVVIQLRYSEYLTLCEVQVFGVAAPGPETGTGETGGSASNVALKKTAFQSSDYSTGAKKGEAYRAVDGNTSPLRFKYWSCSVTNKDPKPWWAVDLGLPYVVRSVTIYNRAENYSYRLKKFDIIVTTERPSDKSPPDPRDGLCFHQEAQPKDVQTFECINNLFGRYVVIRLGYSEYLTLCEVQVNGFPLTLD